jgi:uncharacterized protein (TIGR03086 family)
MTEATTRNRMADIVRTDAVLNSLERTHEHVTTLIIATDETRWPAPTPCAEWRVEELLEHLVTLNLRYAATANREQPPDPDPDLLRPDPPSAYRAAVRASNAAFSRKGMLNEWYPSPWGEMKGAAIAQHVVNELLAHACDLAIALQRPTDVLPDLYAESLTIWQAWFEQMGGRPDQDFAPETEPPADANPAERVAAFLGRTVPRPWTPRAI